MNQQKFISSNIFVFSKWSRKAYAVFASLGKLIRIGVLKAEICQKALLKGLVDLNRIIKTNEDFDEDETVLDTKIQNSLQFLLSAMGLSIFQAFRLISLSKEERRLRTKFLSEYKVCFLPNVKNRLFLCHNFYAYNEY